MTFYDCFLATVSAGERQTLDGVFTWWRHAASRTASTAAPCSGLQVITQQALSPMMCSTCNAWAHMEEDKILEPLQQASPPLSNSSFKTTFTQLCTDMASQHTAREVQELAQHADREASKDCWDAQQTFKGRFRVPKTKEVMRLLNVSSEDNLPETLQSLGCNKKKSDDIHILLGAINKWASSLASAANEDTSHNCLHTLSISSKASCGLPQEMIYQMASCHSTSHS